MLGKDRRELTSVSGAADRAFDALRYPIKVAFGIEDVPDQTPGATLTAGKKYVYLGVSNRLERKNCICVRHFGCSVRVRTLA